MGLFDKYVAKMAAKAPDHKTLLAEALGPDDAFVGFAMVVPSAFERGGGGGSDAASKLLNKAINVASTAVSTARHVGGEPGTTARSLPTDRSMDFGVLSANGFSLWSFGPMVNEATPEFVLRVPGEQIASVVDTGQKAQGGHKVLRFTFTDDSFFDYRVHPSYAEFFDGCLTRWPA